ncbi:pyrimidine dimer DNA glycosylase/endonuclease V [Timonella sp. A28]|uniref:pyrimidine dimer DNA glycosylase/endonuclease V n=1 Tax=Timonella sp. A28 TaxID=3442640 RepID=UPI003EBC900C
MRVWSLHPSLLDRQGLLACWRETLLAQAVLAGKTKGYTRHPQLVRFRATSDPVVTVSAYLHGIADEAHARSYNFDRSRVLVDAGECGADKVSPLTVTLGQVQFEWQHLTRKLLARSPEVWENNKQFDSLMQVEDTNAVSQLVHPLFVVVLGGVETWEKP